MAYQAADIAEAIAEINQLSTEELKELCNSTSDEKYDQLVAKSQKVSLSLVEFILLSRSPQLTKSSLPHLVQRPFRLRLLKLNVIC